MSWYYNPPQSFPMYYFATLRQASSRPNNSIIFKSFATHKEALASAEHFRYFRWCIRQDPNANKEMANILSNYEIRTFLTSDAFGHFLNLIAKPTKLSEFIRLNPELSEQILYLIE